LLQQLLCIVLSFCSWFSVSCFWIDFCVCLGFLAWFEMSVSKTAVAGNKGGSPSVGRGGKSGRSVGRQCVGGDWVQCGECDEWVVYENSGVKGVFDAKALKDVEFVCRVCRLERRMKGQEGICGDGVLGERLRAVELSLTEVKKRLEKCESELEVMRVAWKDLQDKMKDDVGEVCSKVAVGEAKCEEKIGALQKTVSEMKDRVQALGMKVEEFRMEFPTPGEWIEVQNKKKLAKSGSSSIKKEVGFADKYKMKDKDTVMLIGASQVRGLGRS
jgi:hypothetical protein